jgi:hypothetical protein
MENREDEKRVEADYRAAIYRVDRKDHRGDINSVLNSPQRLGPIYSEDSKAQGSEMIDGLYTDFFRIGALSWWRR